jgi:hypothetical protein
MTKPTRRTTRSGTATGQTRVASTAHHAAHEEETQYRRTTMQDRVNESSARNTNMMFLLKDFEKVFDVYIYQHSESSEATKMFVTLCTVPFVLMSILASQIKSI